MGDTGEGGAGGRVGGDSYKDLLILEKSILIGETAENFFRIGCLFILKKFSNRIEFSFSRREKTYLPEDPNPLAPRSVLPSSSNVSTTLSRHGSSVGVHTCTSR